LKPLLKNLTSPVNLQGKYGVISTIWMLPETFNSLSSFRVFDNGSGRSSTLGLFW